MPRPFPTNISTGGVLFSDGGPGITTPGAAGPPAASFTAAVDLTGSSQAQQVVGFRGRPVSGDAPDPGDAYIFDGTEFVPAVPPGSLIPLSRTLWVDGSTTHPPEEWDGSIARPFGFVHTAVEHIDNSDPAATDWLVLIEPGLYANSDSGQFVFVPPGRNITFQGAGSDVSLVLFTYSTTPTFYIPQQDGDPEARVTFRNLSCAVCYALDAAAGGLTIRFDRCRVYALQSSQLLFPTVQYADVEGYYSVITFAFFDTQFGDVRFDHTDASSDFEADYFECRNGDLFCNCTIRGEIVDLIDTRFADNNSIVFQNGFGTVNLDGHSTGSPEVFNGKAVLADSPERTATAELSSVDSPVSVEMLAPPTEYPSALTIEVWATAIDTVTGDAAGFQYTAAYKGVATPYPAWFIVGTVSEVHKVREQAGWDLALSDATAGNAYLVLTVDTPNPVRWTLRWRVTPRPFGF